MAVAWFHSVRFAAVGYLGRRTEKLVVAAAGAKLVFLDGIRSFSSFAKASIFRNDNFKRLTNARIINVANQSIRRRD